MPADVYCSDCRAPAYQCIEGGVLQTSCDGCGMERFDAAEGTELGAVARFGIYRGAVLYRRRAGRGYHAGAEERAIRAERRRHFARVLGAGMEA